MVLDCNVGRPGRERMGQNLCTSAAGLRRGAKFADAEFFGNR
jgi:hypothetical protein